MCEQTCVYAHAHEKHRQTHTRARAHARGHAHAHTHVCARTHICARAGTCARVHACKHARKPMCTHAHTHAHHTHTKTHTHTHTSKGREDIYTHAHTRQPQSAPSTIKNVHAQETYMRTNPPPTPPTRCRYNHDTYTQMHRHTVF
jgi:hypothetical protein